MNKKPPITADARAELQEFGDKQKHGPIMAALYRQAKARLRKKQKNQPSTAADTKSKAGPQRLLHELQVHQIELEMQNIELQESRDRMEVLLDKYTDLYDFAPVGYLSLDEQGRILEANLIGAALLGVERSRLISKSSLQFVSPASQPAYLAFLKQFCKVAMIRADVGEFRASLIGNSAITVEVPRKCCRVALWDISALVRAEEAQDRLAAIVESSDDAIIGMDSNGIITSWNKGAKNIFGYPAGEIVGSSIMRLVPAERQNEENKILAKIKRGKSLQHFETLRRTRDGRLINVSVTASPIKDAGGRVVGVSKVARDISGRKRVEEILRRNEDLFSTLIRQAPVGVYVVDGQLRLQQANPKARQVFKNVRPLLGRHLAGILRSIWPAKLAGEIHERFRQTLKTGKPYYAREFSGRRHNIAATEFYEWQLQPIVLPAGDHGVVCFFENITERKQAEETRRRLDVMAASNLKLKQEIVRREALEESLKRSEQYQRHLLAVSHRMQQQLRQLSRQVLQAQEEERRRISRELHDVIAQTLTGINIRLSTLKKEAGLSRRGFDRNLEQTRKLVEKSVEIVHQFARELRPAVLDDLGLIPALHSFAKLFSQRTRIHVHLKIPKGIEQLSSDQRTILYRVAQEAFTNVARHAKAGRVELSITKQPDRISMNIQDDGKSFDVERVLQAKNGKHLGLLGMRERLEMVGGNFGVVSTPGSGTTITAQIPLRKNAGGGR
jgi:PAS domain S-box-containing protein